MDKRFNVFMTDAIHTQIKVAATLNGVSMNEFILKAITDALKKQK